MSTNARPSWLLIAAVLWAVPTPAAATTYTWIGPTGGEWNEPAHWSPSTGFPSTFEDKAIINGGAGTLAVAIPAGIHITVQQLQVNSGSGLIAVVGINASLGFAPLPGQPSIDCTGGLEINTPIGLGHDLIVRVGAASTLTFQKPITDTESPKNFRKQGPGLARFNSSNSYTGSTIIEQGSLLLQQPNAIPDTSAVELRPGTFLTAQKEEVLGPLTIVEATVDINKFAALGVPSLHMTGGTILSSNGGAILYLLGNATATSSPSQTPASIEASIGVELFDATRTFTVLDGPGAVDMLISAFILTAHQPDTGLIKDGPGTLFFPSSGTSNDQRGLTWVKEGRVRAARPIGRGDLRIGDGTGSAEVVCETSSVVQDFRSVTVDADGVYDVTGQGQILTQLTLNGGTVHVGGALAQLYAKTLAMNGGVIDTGATPGNGGQIATVGIPDNARIEATSTQTQTPIVRGAGKLVLGAYTDLVVNDGPRAIDAIIDVEIVSTGSGVVKSGLGVARFTRNNTYSGDTSVDRGTLLIDGSQLGSQIIVSLGTLGGTGTTARVEAVSGGTIAPGASPGILHVGHVKFAGAVFAAEVNGTTAGTAYDQLRVTGTVLLTNATLALAVGPGVTLPLDAKVTLVDNDGVDPIAGTFTSLPEAAPFVIGRYTFAVSYVGGDGNDVVLTVTNVAPDVLTYYLAEGATGSFFDEDVLIANPNDTDAPVTLTFLQEGGGTIVEHRTVPKQGRLTVRVDQIAGLENASPSVQVASDQKLPLVVERSMFWDASYYGGHTANAVEKPEQKWIFAEGFQGFFDTYLLIANANPTEATATVTFLRENDTPVVKTIPIAAFARKTVYAGDFSELLGRAFGIVVESTLPVIAERSMYFASIPGRLWTGGHVNTGVNAPSTSWFHAEGATGGFFNTFILLSNPQATDAHIDLQFLLEDGTAIVKTKTLPAGQRLTVNPAAEGDPRLENAALSTIVASDVPIVSERSMYWPGDATPFGEGHNSSGVVATSTRWGLAEGRIGSPRQFTTYILLANPSTTTANVTVTYLREIGAPVTKTYTVQPTSRFNIDVASAVPELQNESFGARIEVTNGVAIAVERSLYWDANGIFWAGGTNALATPLPLTP